MLLRVTHTTRYTYQSAVSFSLNEVRLTPRSSSGQEVQSSELRVLPAPAFMHNRKDYYGNDVTAFELLEKHAELEITAESIVQVRPEPAGGPSIGWEEARQNIAAASDAACLEASEFVYPSPYVPFVPQIEHYAKTTFTEGRSLFEAVHDLTHRIHADFKYRPQSTSIDIALHEVMRHRRGVCQDFAHVMIGALRSHRLSARYVSGYVLPGPRVQGAQASHAWVSVFFPGNGWLSFDPTNDLMVSDSHVTLAWGRDYGDVTPVKGISLGGGGQTVKVEAYVRSAENQDLSDFPLSSV
jgi:transglutaminase-like putative cysteine protease